MQVRGSASAISVSTLGASVRGGAGFASAARKAPLEQSGDAGSSSRAVVRTPLSSSDGMPRSGGYTAPVRLGLAPAARQALEQYRAAAQADDRQQLSQILGVDCYA